MVNYFYLLTICFIFFLSPPVFSGSTQPIENTKFECKELSGEYSIIKIKNGEEKNKSFKKIKKKYRKKKRKFKKKVKKLDNKSLGKPEPKYSKIINKLHKNHVKKNKYEKIFNDVKCCESGNYVYDDHTDPGLPIVKTSWTVGRENGFQNADDKPDETASQASSYNSTKYFVRSKTLHGTTVTVAIHNTNLSREDVYHTPDEFADVMIGIFHNLWHIVDGFPLDGYLIKIRAVGESDDFSISQGFFVAASDDYKHLDLSHEIIHSIIAKTFTYVSNGLTLFQLETWIQEGATIYYSARIDGEVVGKYVYRDNMDAYWSQYLERRGTKYDLAYAELASKVTGTGGSEERIMMWAKDTAINYILDKKMIELGYSLDDLIKYLYINYGLKGIQFKQSDIPTILQEITGQSFNDLFDTYLNSNGDLTKLTDGDHPFLSHTKDNCN